MYFVKKLKKLDKSLDLSIWIRAEVSNFFVRGPHELSHNSPRAGHLMLCDCFGLRYILPNKQVFCKYIVFFHF